MSFFVYIIYSISVDQYYVGHTNDLDNRILRHKNSGSKSTKKVTDWTLVYSEHYSTRAEAYKREMEIKKKKSRKYIETLINSVQERPA